MMQTSNLSHVDFLNQRNKFLEAVEELRYFRISNAQLENKISKLLAEKIQLGDAVEKYKSQLNRSEGKAADLEEQLRNLGGRDRDSKITDENNKLKIALSAAESTINELKSKIVNFSSVRDDLEKTLATTEKKLLVSKQACDSFLDRTAQFQVNTQKIGEQLNKAHEVQSRLERNIENSGKIIRNLMQMKEHQGCVIEDLRKEKSNLISEVANLKSKLIVKESGPENTINQLESLKTQLESASRAVELIKWEKENCEKQLHTTKANLSDALQVAAKSNQLLERNEELNNKTKSELQMEIDDLREKLKSVNDPITKIQVTDDNAVAMKGGLEKDETTTAPSDMQTNINDCARPQEAICQKESLL